ncbi:MAG: CocE/NonD family hydrolase [Candidatus Heimdallarchaeota archaeon]|nr:CocE/NonD family hydrolase [Candidatus Heimdallarchaeota archaeon]MCK5142287.1 CocE/NonD family hydrolase [Candidatus Heimdallarchaeota archaeon]
MKDTSNQSDRRLPKPHSQPTYNLTVKDWRIHMRDGIRLYAKAWHPKGDGPFPAVINYDPYRSSDWRTMSRGNFFHFLARHGYVVLHLGVRGTDGSEGNVSDEYPLQEQEDGYDAVEWVAAQSWCNGNVGMIGTSYAGFTAVQVAMHQPPHLKAIIPLYATDDRYTDDVHYNGGALCALFDLAGWATMMVSMNALPPPESLGEDYERVWNEHLESNSPYQLNWLENQTDGPYWRPASLRPNFDLIKCPVFVIGAWRDFYRNSAMRMYEHLTVPKKLLMGPWGHVFPDWGYPGQPINFMPQAVRWFDHWLKDIDTGIMDEPDFTAFMRESSFTKPDFKSGLGYWRQVNAWPLKDKSKKRFFLSSQQKLQAEIEEKGSDTYIYHVTVGMGNPTWHAHIAKCGEKERNHDEMNSLSYTSGPLNERLEIMGHPQLKLIYAATAPVVNVFVKLFDIAPDGTSDIVSWGTLNVTHRDSHTNPKPLTPGEQVELNIDLDATSWIFHPGHNIKITLAGSDFPNFWPSPYPAENTIWWGKGYESCLILPIVPESHPDKAPLFGEIEMSMNKYELKYSPAKSTLTHNLQDGKTTFQFSQNQKGKLPEDGVSLVFDEDSSFTVSDSNPAHALLKNIHDIQVITKNSRSRALTNAQLESDEDNFHIKFDLVVTVDEKEKFKRSWSRSFKRNLV